MNKKLPQDGAEFWWTMPFIVGLGVLLGWAIWGSDSAQAGRDTPWPAWVQALGSVGAIVVAIVVARRQGRAAQIDRHASFRPIVVQSSIVQPTENQFEVSLHNVGIGPAIIKKFSVLVDGRPLDIVGEMHAWSTAFVNHVNLSNRSPQIGGNSIGPGLPIGAGQSISVCRATERDAHWSNDDLAWLYYFRSLLRIDLEYESVFGDSFSLSLRFPTCSRP